MRCRLLRNEGGCGFGGNRANHVEVISIASAEVPVIPAEFESIAYAVLFVAIAGGCLVYYRAALRLLDGGGRVRSDLFSVVDMPVLGVLVTFFGLTAAAAFLVATPAESMALKPEQILPSAIQIAVFPLGVVIFLIARNVSLVEVFGLRRVRLARALAYALGFLAALLPLFVLVTDLAARQLGSDAQLQPLVELYQAGVKQRDWRVIWSTILAAAVIAPIGEEILFRGYLYPAMKRFIGAVPSGIFGAVLFAAIHNNAVGMPGLTLLALALTIAYEWSGSLLVPIFIHCFFNSLSLAVSAWMALSPK